MHCVAVDVDQVCVGAAEGDHQPALLEIDVGLAGQEAFGVHGAGGHPADRLAALVHHRVAVVGHAHALLGEAETDHHALAGLLVGDESLTPDEVGLVGFDVGAEAAFRHAQVGLAHLAGAESHFVAVQGQPSLGAQAVARAQADRLDAKLSPAFKTAFQKSAARSGCTNNSKAIFSPV